MTAFGFSVDEVADLARTYRRCDFPECNRDSWVVMAGDDRDCVVVCREHFTEEAVDMLEGLHGAVLMMSLNEAITRYMPSAAISGSPSGYPMPPSTTPTSTNKTSPDTESL